MNAWRGTLPFVSSRSRTAPPRRTSTTWRQGTSQPPGVHPRRPGFPPPAAFLSTLPVDSKKPAYRPKHALRNLSGALGEWFLLPAEIHTSPRRFEVEGLYERQVLNAILMNFAAMAWELFFRDILSIYPNHDQSTRLDLYRLLSRIRRLIATPPPTAAPVTLVCHRSVCPLPRLAGSLLLRHPPQLPAGLATGGRGELCSSALYDRYLERSPTIPPVDLLPPFSPLPGSG